MKWYTRVIFFLLIAVPISLGLFKKKPPEDAAPVFPQEAVWIPFKPAERNIFKNKVTLVYFWDYTSANCLRDLTFLKQWWRRYAPFGLQIILVHSPEFEFAKNRKHLESALARYDISLPVVMDNDFKIWSDYKIVAWPTKVLVNPQGVIQHRQIGEGEYRLTELQIRRLLHNLAPEFELPEPVIKEELESYDTDACGPMSAETYIGYKRAHWWGAEVANENWIKREESSIFKDRGDRVERGFFLHGLWRNEQDYFVHDRETDDLSDYLGLLYYGYQVFSVMGPGSAIGEVRVYVTRDGQPLPPERRGVDLREDGEGRTYVLVEEPRLYELVRNEDDEQHEIKLWTRHQGVAISSFSFANYCLGQIDFQRNPLSRPDVS